MLDIALTVILAGIAAVMAWAGVYMSAHPPESEGHKSLYKRGFMVGGIVSVLLVGWQAKRNGDSQDSLTTSISSLTTQLGSQSVQIENLKRNTETLQTQTLLTATSVVRMEKEISKPVAPAAPSRAEVFLQNTGPGMAIAKNSGPINTGPVTINPVRPKWLLTPEQSDRVIYAMKPHAEPKTVVLFRTTMGDKEGADFAQSLADALGRAGFSINPNMRQLVGSLGIGVQIWVPDANNPACIALLNVLERLKIPASLKVSPDFLPNTLQISVGDRPSS